MTTARGCAPSRAMSPHPSKPCVLLALLDPDESISRIPLLATDELLALVADPAGHGATIRFVGCSCTRHWEGESVSAAASSAPAATRSRGLDTS